MAAAPKYSIELSEAEREQLEDLFKRGKHGALKLKRARIMLLRDRDQHGVRETAHIVGVSPTTVVAVAKRYCQQGFERALCRRKQSGRPKVLDTKGEAVLYEIAESKPPEGHKRWTLELLANRLVTLQIADKISLSTVARTLKKKGISHML